MRTGGFVISERGGPPSVRAPWWRVPSAVVGLVVVLLGVVALVPAMVILGALVLGLRLQGSVDLGDDPAIGLWFAASLLVGWILVRVGIRLLRGPRHSALFLRRFGFTGATEVLTLAITRGLGRRWRVVTLDDLRVTPVGVGGRSQWVFRIGAWVLAAGFVVLVAWLVPLWFDSIFDDTLEDLSRQAQARAEEEGQSPIEAAVGTFFALLVAGVLTGIFVLLGLLLPAALAGSLALFTLGGRRAIRRAESRRALEIHQERQIDRVTRRIRRTTRRIYAPRLTVVRCANEVWQAVVLRLARVTDAVLIDVSEPSAGLLWELDRLRPDLASRWVLVGQEDRLHLLLEDPSEPAAHLRSLLDGQVVLPYRVGDPARFEHEVRARLSRAR